MSYVLEALKKAEADKDPNARTSLLLEHREQRRSRLLLTGVIVALLTNGFVLLWLFYPRADLSVATGGVPAQISDALVSDARTVRDNGAPPQSEAQSAPSPATEPARTTKPETIAPGATNEAARVTQPPAAAPVPEPIKKASIRIGLAALPVAARGRFPGLVFSTHIYADDPSLRALVVNGTRMIEGDRYEALELREITEEGAVFAFEEYLVSVSVIDTWD